MGPGRSEARAGQDLAEPRQAAAQQAYRLVNEGIDALQARFGAVEALELLCECGDPSCSRRALVGHEAYAELRAHPRRFVFAPGHPLALNEWVIEEQASYLAVEVAERGVPAVADGEGADATAATRPS
jgi:hypothetical protein